MLVESDSKSGFCFGVQNAVEIAEEALRRGEKVYSLGSIVHNDMEVARLKALGLETVNHEKFRQLSGCNVLIRAHGEPPETYAFARENNIKIIEATCPIVKKLQAKIRQAWERSREGNGQVVIFGKPGHAEVVGLIGQTGNEAILVSGADELGKIDFTRPVQLFSQTTMGVHEFEELAGLIRTKMKESGVKDPDEFLEVKKTICGQVSNREPHLKEFAAKHEIIIFVSGRESSNGKMLYSVCKDVNPETYFVSTPEEIDRKWFIGKKTAGICGATSTPKWLIEKIHKQVEQF